jgi:alkanesulfonate monooxygenase SsuD/methylene tetrahydromethanopterin reductase-like flavin-dependent oxidoreductase (luciferase family)
MGVNQMPCADLMLVPNLPPFPQRQTGGIAVAQSTKLKLGYLMPTRENVMAGKPEVRPLLELAERAEKLGYDSVWAGDSLLARPRHEPLSLLAAVAGRLSRVQIGTAVLLPALRNPVLLAHQVATIDQISQGRLILGVGIASDVPNIRAEFMATGVPWEKRVGRMMEGFQLAKALWSGKPVDWNGRWTVEKGTLGPTPYRAGGPPIWAAGAAPASLDRTAKHFDGWLPNGSDPAKWAGEWAQIKASAEAVGRDPASLTGGMYLTVVVDDDVARAEQRLDAYLAQYYGQPAAAMKARQTCFAGSAQKLAGMLGAYGRAGTSHIVLRFAGDHERHLETVAGLRDKIA